MVLGAPGSRFQLPSRPAGGRLLGSHKRCPWWVASGRPQHLWSIRRNSAHNAPADTRSCGRGIEPMRIEPMLVDELRREVVRLRAALAEAMDWNWGNEPPPADVVERLKSCLDFRRRRAQFSGRHPGVRESGREGRFHRSRRHRFQSRLDNPRDSAPTPPLIDAARSTGKCDRYHDFLLRELRLQIPASDGLTIN
jgi:hypothetical protein